VGYLAKKGIRWVSLTRGTLKHPYFNRIVPDKTCINHPAIGVPPHDLGNIPWNINRGHLDPTGIFSEKNKQLPEKSGVMALWPTLPPKKQW